ncbi:hypothetical protein BH11MYX3_BH11MYX3_20340 [soil metagenome]
MEVRVLVVSPHEGRAGDPAVGVAVEYVESAIEGLAHLRAQRFAAIVVEDLEVMLALRAAGHDLPILVRTPAGDDATALRALALGATDFVPVSVTGAELDLRIRGLLARRTDPRAIDDAQLRALALFPQLNPTAVMRLSATGEILYANPAAFTLAHATGHELVQVLPETTQDIVREVIASDHAWPVLETKHGTRTLSWTFLPIVAMQVVHCYVVDITDRLALEDQLRQSQKMDAIGHLAGGIAHDFNNLLTVIYANTMLLQRRQPSEALRSVAAASERAADLVRQLLAFSRQQVLQTRDVELNRTIVNLVKLLDHIVREDIELRLDLADHPVWARADASMLDQVVMNLVVNARDAMPHGGTLSLSTSVFILDDEDKRAMPELAPGAYARVRVTDTGIGIAPEHLASVFDPFFTTKELGKGTGLGLATVFGIVKQHAGAVAVTSEVGRGSTFSVLLPSARETTFAEEIHGEPIPITPRGGTESILIVEDEDLVRRIVEQVLVTSGYRVCALATGADALDLLATSDQRIDVVLTDMVMPGGVSGRDLAEQLRRTHPSIKVIYMSGYAGASAGVDLPLRAGVDFLQKPFSPAALLACVRASIDSIN